MKLTEIVENFGKAKVAVIGDFNVDALVYGRHVGFSRESAAPKMEVSTIRYHPGATANLAANILSLGVGKLYPIGTIGNRHEDGVILTVGDFLWDYFSENEKVNNKLIKCDRQTYTYLKFMPKGEGTSTSPQQYYRADLGSKEPLTRELEDQIISNLDESMSDCDILVVSNHGKGNITPSILEYIKNSYKNKIKMGTARKHANRLVGFDILALNDYETVEPYFKIDDDDTKIEEGRIKYDVLKDAADSLISETLTKNLVVSRGSYGISLFISKVKEFNGKVSEHIHIPTQPKEVIDITGAGDTTLAAIVAALGAKANLENAAKIGNYAGGLAIQKQGTATITQEELLEEIKKDVQG